MSSFFDSASLVQIPSGYKVGTVYSVKPIDGDGDLTFTRSNDTATRVGPDGLIEKVRTNLLLQSNTFSTTWAFSGTGTVTTGVTDPFGGTTAWTLAKTTANTFRYQSTAGITGSTTFSIYAKAGTIDQLWLNHDQGGSFSSYFDLTLGTAISATGCVATIVSVGGGWYRCSIAGTSVTPNNIRIYPASGGSISGTTGNILIYAAQAETGDIATAPITTLGTAVSVGPVANLPRLDYSGGATCPKLLLEPQRTNASSQSEDFNAWPTKVNVTTTANYAVSPDGYTNADRLLFTGSGFMYPASGVSQTTSTVYTLSCYAKRNGSGTQSIGFFINGSGGINSAWTLTSEWQRFTFTYTAGNSSVVGIGGASGADVSVYGFQFEIGSYATSYIPTLSAATTRGADSALKTGIASLIGQAAGTLFCEINSSNFESYTQRVFTLSDDTNNNVIGIQLTGANEIVFYVENGGVNQVAITKATPAITLGQNVKIAAAYKANDFVLYVNGVQVGTDTSGSVPASSVLRYANPTGTNPYIGKVAQSLLFPTRLTNAQLAELTA